MAEIFASIETNADFKSDVTMAYGTVSSDLKEHPKLKFITEEMAIVYEPSVRFASKLAHILEKRFKHLNYEDASDESGYVTFKITKE